MLIVTFYAQVAQSPCNWEDSSTCPLSLRRTGASLRRTGANPLSKCISSFPQLLPFLSGPLRFRFPYLLPCLLNPNSPLQHHQYFCFQTFFMAITSIFLVSNIHCPSCVSHAEHVLRDIPDLNSPPHVSLIEHTIRIKHANPETQHLILTALLKAAFEVQHVTTLDSFGRSTEDYDVTPEPTSSSASRSTWLMSKTQRKHIKNCQACQRDRSQAKMETRSRASLASALHLRISNRQSKNVDTPHADKPAIINFDGTSDHPTDACYTATISIGGMTCSSCTTMIRKAVGGYLSLTR